MKLKLFLLILSMALCVNSIFAQNNSEVVRVIGDSLVGKTLDGQSVREVIGNVVMTQGNVKITCRKAIQYISTNKVKLIGDVIVVQDTVDIRTEVGYYFGDKKYAYSDTSIVLTDGRMVLNADEGYYFFDDKKAYFYDNVEMVDTASKLNSDRFYYYHTENFLEAAGHVVISDTSSSIYADSLIHYRENRKTYAFNNIKITNFQNNLIVTGEDLVDDADKNYTRITGSPMLIQIDTSKSGIVDTLVIESEVLESIEDSVQKLIATDSVKIIRGDFSSVNNKTIYYKDGNEIVTHKLEGDKIAPILWYENSQVVGDTVKIYLDENQIRWIDISENSFILSRNKNYPDRFDQISGSNVKMFFNDGKLKRTEVKGNVLSIYYLYEDDNPNGLIQSSSDRAKIYFNESRIYDVRLYGSPASEYHPENLVEDNEKDFVLPSFILYSNRPDKQKILSRLKTIFSN